MEDKLVNLAQQAAEFLNKAGQPILCISHYDCDGISSGVIVHQMLERADKDFEQVFVDELNEEKLREAIDGRDHPVIFFTDIGSGQMETIEEILPDRDILVADHHEPQAEGDIAAHVNPHLVGIENEKTISGAGVTFLVARHMDEDNVDLLPYAIIGATGDVQKENGRYIGLNEEFVEEAQRRGLIEVKQGLKLYGRRSKSLVKALKYTTDPYLQGITNNESGAVQFLQSLNIDLKDSQGEWRSLADLSTDEEQQIVHGLITHGYGDIEQMLGRVYVLNNGWEVQEFSSLLNACGRLEKPEAGIDICVHNDFELAWKLKRDYGRKIGRYLSFVEDNRENTEVVRELENGTAILADRSIHPHMIGTVTSICTKSDILPGPVLIGMAEKEQDFLKISARVKDGVDGIQINDVMEQACADVGGEGGGHSHAAGGKIPKEKQESFINVMSEVLKEASL